jgi:hypothetical protein
MIDHGSYMFIRCIMLHCKRNPQALLANCAGVATVGLPSPQFEHSWERSCRCSAYRVTESVTEGNTDVDRCRLSVGRPWKTSRLPPYLWLMLIAKHFLPCHLACQLATSWRQVHLRPIEPRLSHVWRIILDCIQPATSLYFSFGKGLQGIYRRRAKMLYLSLSTSI